MKCPKCHFDNPDDTAYCGKCAAPLKSAEEIEVSVTKTISKPSEELPIGSTFAGKYKIIGELGRGGMGVVYEAEDTKLKRRVALKFLPPELTDDPEARERFVREAQAAAALSYPNICTIYEIDEDEEKTFIAMEYIEGQTLVEKIKQAPLKLDEALDIALRVAEGLDEAHKKRIIHRDIKSANIMVTNKGQAKIMDFGLAKVVGGTLITKEAKTMGTVAYMSPEQARGEAVDHRTDIWSFGVVLYEMLSGQLPFLGEREPSIIHSIIYEEPKPLKAVKPDIPSELEQVVKKALAKNPDERYPDIKGLLEDLRSISKGLEPITIKTLTRKLRLARIKRAYLYTGMAALIIFLFAVGWLLFTGRPQSIEWIAVLPLQNLSGDPSQEYFSDGMTDALITALSKISSLNVVSRTSVMRFKNTDKPLPEIAKELHVDAIVEGSALRVAEQVRINVQLIEAATDRHLWAESFDRDFRDILMLQREIARDIASEVKIAVTPEEEKRLASARRVNPEAHEAYLKGRYYWNKATEESLKTSIDYFEQAIEKDPDYALAYAGLADSYINLVAYGILPPREAMPKAKAAAMKALELDDTLAEAHTSLGQVRKNYDWDWAEAKREFQRAIELNPNSAEAHLRYSMYLVAMGRYDEALAEKKRARALDPLSLFINQQIGQNYYHVGQYDQAIEEHQKTLEMDPNFYMVHIFLSWNYLQKGMYEEALTEAQKAADLSRGDPIAVAGLGYVYGVSGRRDEAMKTLDKLKKRKHVVPFHFAMIYIGMDEKDQAFEWLERSYEERDSWMIWLKSRFFDSLRSDPRFTALLKKMNLE